VTSDLLFGLLVFAVGLGFAVVHAIHLIREQRAHLDTGGARREHVLSLVFLGGVPMLAGMLFLSAWWAGKDTTGTTAIAVQQFAPQR